jgi:hypothetical protein
VRSSAARQTPKESYISHHTGSCIIRAILRLLEDDEPAAYLTYVRSSAARQTPKEPY